MNTTNTTTIPEWAVLVVVLLLLFLGVLCVVCSCCHGCDNQRHVIAVFPRQHQDPYCAAPVPVVASPYPPAPPAANNPYPPASGYPASPAPHPTAATGYPPAGYSPGYPAAMQQPLVATAPACDAAPPSYEQPTHLLMRQQQLYEKHPPYNPHAPPQ